MSGRPTKLTPEAQETIVKALLAGNYAAVAAGCAGIDDSTYYRWIERGEPDGTLKRDAPYRDFRAAVEQAKAQAEARMVAQITRAGKNHWSALAWLLSRRWPERWGAQRQTKRWPFGRSSSKSGGDQAKPRRSLRKLTPKELRKIRGRASQSG